MKPGNGSKLVALSLCASLGAAPSIAAADDIDIFTGASAGSSINPRILVVLDNTSNWSRQSQQWPGGLTQGRSEARALRSLLPTLTDKINFGVMEYVTGSSSGTTADGGFIRSAVLPMDDGNKTLLNTELGIIYDNITAPTEKINANTPYGNLMYDVYNYFAGANSYAPSAVLASKADERGYSSAYARFQSPLTKDNTCGRSFVIFIGNPNSSGPTADSPANTTALTTLTDNRTSSGALIPVTQLGLPNFTTQSVSTSTNIGVTSACYASKSAAAAELGAFASTCDGYTEGCSIGEPTLNIAPIACASGTLSYSVVQSVFHPATSSPGTPVVGTATSSSGTTTGYYASAETVSASDHGELVCPATSTTTSGGNTATTTYECTYTLGAPLGSATSVDSSASTSQAGNPGGDGCYTGVGTASGNWNPATSSDHGGMSCPANSSCTYSGASVNSAAGCVGSGYRKVTVTQSATPMRQYAITQKATPTTVNSSVTAATTTTSTLGKTSQCYASAPASTSDYAASCSGENVTCSYGNAPTASTLGSCPGGSSAYRVVGTNIELTDVATGTTSTDTKPLNADEWARLLHDKGVPVADSLIRPSVTTYTIDVYNKQPNAAQTSLLMSMAKAGGGKYFAAKNEQAIVDALKQIMMEIQAVNTSFASTSLPVNATNRSQNENQVFIGMFRPDPDAKPRWFGNLKRYQLISAGSSIQLGDVNGNAAVNTLTGFLTPCATSYWTGDSGSYWSGMGLTPDPVGTCATSVYNKYSDAPDGPLVEKGAVAQILRQGNVASPSTSQAVNRNMYTLSGGAVASFDAAGSGLSDSLVRFIRGEDVNNEKAISTGATVTTRPSIHGDVIHSRPLPVNFGSAGVIVYYGSNDGTYRAVNAQTGVEMWSFVAPEFFPRLARLKDNSPRVKYPNQLSGLVPAPEAKDYFFDGSTGVFQNRDSSDVWIYPTMRRGGRMIYAFKVTPNDTRPVFKWRAGCPNLTNDSDCTADMSGIGQTWSIPSVAFIKGYSTTRPVVVVGGGYENCEDLNQKDPACGAKGGFVYLLDGFNGTVIRKFATARGVAADVALVDIDNDGFPDYAYAADLGGSLYRVDFIKDPGTRATLASTDWKFREVAYTRGGGRKFIFSPALLYSNNKVYVAIGSGDREHPLQSDYPYTDVVNRFYVYKDDLSAADTTAARNLDTMENYTSSSACTTAPVLPDSGLSGWFMDLNQYGQGEQVVTTALIAGGMVTFSTNRPVPATAGTCATALGQARGYWVNLLNASGGVGVAGSCGGKRSGVFIGGGLPPSPVMASSVPIDGKSVSVVIGAVQKDDLPSAAISPQRVRPTITFRRKRAYNYTSGD